MKQDYNFDIDKFKSLSNEEKASRKKDLNTFLKAGFPNKQNEDWKFSDLNAILNKSFDKITNNFEFDLNKHFRSFKEGHKNLKTPFYSFTFWNWFQSIAIESGGQNFMTSTEQFSVRRSELVPSDLVTEIINDGLFSIYFHYLKDNTKSYGLFKVTNPEVLKDCFT